MANNVDVKDAADVTVPISTVDKTGAGNGELQLVGIDYGAGTARQVLTEKPATEAAQTTGNASLASIDGKVATENTLLAVRDSIRAQIDAASTVWTDNSGAYYVRRDSVNQGTGAVTVAFFDPQGNAATPGAGLRPLSQADRDVTQALFDATASGTGYSLGDLIARVLIIDANPASPTVTAIWVNLSTGAVIAAPTGGTIERADENIGARQVGTWTVTANAGSGTFNVSAGSLPLPAGASTETSLAALLAAFNARVPTLLGTVPGVNVSAPPVRQVGQDIWTCSFAQSGASFLAPDFAAPIVGTGVTYNQTNGSLNILTGTTANAEFFTRSTVSWRGAMQLRASIVASQRIANQNLAIMLADLIGEGLTFNIVNATTVDVTVPTHGFTAQNVGQFMNLGGITGAAGAVPGRYAIASIPNADTIRFTVAGWPASGSGSLTLFGWNFVRNLVTGVTATNIAFTAQRRGWADADTTATINTTASPGTIIQATLHGREAFLGDSLRASTTAPDFVTRATRHENLPDDDVSLFVFLWSFNGSTAPASTTTWTIGFVSVEKFANIPVYVQGQRAQGNSNAAPTKLVAALPAGANVIGALTANQTVNVAQWGGAAPMAPAGAGGTNRAVGVIAAAPITVADVTAAARTASGNSGTIAQDLGNIIAGQITVTAVTGTSPTLDLTLEESWDNGTTWNTVWAAPRVTAAANIMVPPMTITGRRRWVWTIGGTTPSFTIGVNVMASTGSAPIIRSLIDRSIAPNTLGSNSAALMVEGCRSFSLFVLSGAGATSSPAYGIFLSPDGVNWLDSGITVTVAASSFGGANITTPFPARFARVQIKSAGVAATHSFAHLTAIN